MPPNGTVSMSTPDILPSPQASSQALVYTSAAAIYVVSSVLPSTAETVPTILSEFPAVSSTVVSDPTLSSEVGVGTPTETVVFMTPTPIVYMQPTPTIQMLSSAAVFSSSIQPLGTHTPTITVVSIPTPASLCVQPIIPEATMCDLQTAQISCSGDQIAQCSCTTPLI